MASQVTEGNTPSEVTWQVEGWVTSATVGAPLVVDFASYDGGGSCNNAGGGALHLSGGMVAEARRCDFRHSQAVESAGGTLLVRSSSPLDGAVTAVTLKDCTVAHSSATYFGSVAYNSLSEVYVESSFVDNTTLSSQQGVYFNSGGSYECLSSCPAGTFGACQALDECFSCSPGCEACPAGTANGLRGSVAAEACSDCASGRYSASAGLSECLDDCPAGYYVTDDANDTDASGVTVGATHCLACPASTFAASAMATSCATCAEGRTSPRGATECGLCLRNTYDKNTATNGTLNW